MIPTEIGEAKFRASNSLFNICLELLNILQPEQRDLARLKVYGRVIDTISGGETLDAELIQELSLLTSSQHFMQRATRISVLLLYHGCQNDNHGASLLLRGAYIERDNRTMQTRQPA